MHRPSHDCFIPHLQQFTDASASIRKASMRTNARAGAASYRQCRACRTLSNPASTCRRIQDGLTSVTKVLGNGAVWAKVACSHAVKYMSKAHHPQSSADRAVMQSNIWARRTTHNQVRIAQLCSHEQAWRSGRAAASAGRATAAPLLRPTEGRLRPASRLACGAGRDYPLCVRIGDRGALALHLAGGARVGSAAAPALRRGDAGVIDDGVVGSPRHPAVARAVAAVLCLRLLVMHAGVAASCGQLTSSAATRVDSPRGAHTSRDLCWRVVAGEMPFAIWSAAAAARCCRGSTVAAMSAWSLLSGRATSADHACSLPAPVSRRTSCCSGEALKAREAQGPSAPLPACHSFLSA